ncbi:MAG: DUF72 domain-containing protein [Pseudobdellovibrionaceae bacterium]
MDFGKVPSPWLSKIDFSIPSQDPRTWLQFRMHGEKDGLRVGIGCPVWGVKDWLGSVYPKTADPKDFLFHYSRQFNSIELNTTHYRIPDLPTIRKWRDTVPDDFRFNPKFPQELSHRYPLSPQVPEFKEFVRSMMGLEDKLGITFLQLPPHFNPDHLRELRNFLFALPVDFPVAVEVRHPAFFHEHMLIDPLYDILVKAGAHTVITDVAGRRDVLHTSLTSLKVMVRFIGNDLHPTDQTRIQDWVNLLHHWIELGLKQVEFFIHEPADRNAPHLISQFTDLMNEECNLRIRKWKPEKTAEQLMLFS